MHLFKFKFKMGFNICFNKEVLKQMFTFYRTIILPASQ